MLPLLFGFGEMLVCSPLGVGHESPQHILRKRSLDSRNGQLQRGTRVQELSQLGTQAGPAGWWLSPSGVAGLTPGRKERAVALGRPPWEAGGHTRESGGKGPASTRAERHPAEAHCPFSLLGWG